MLDTGGFLEQALLEEGHLTPAQLAEARKLATETSISVEEAIASTGFVDGWTIANVKAHLCETPFVDLSAYEINYENARLLPKALVERNNVFPLFVARNVVTLGTDDPLNLSVLDDVRQILKKDIDPVQCETSALKEVIARAYGLGLGLDHDVQGEKSTAGRGSGRIDDAGPIVDAVNTILVDAIRLGASDIHLNPDHSMLRIRLRIDGRLQTRQGPSLSMYPKIVQRLKVMGNLDLTQTRRPQDGKFRFTSGSESFDVRMSLVPTVDGENVVLRVLSGNGRVASLDELGMREELRNRIQPMISQPYGMFLVTGPTGSGKTTTLYSILNLLNSAERNVITIEDPVEIRMPMIRQIQINHEIGLTFASALRSVLRQDPDIILVGEIRDEETAEIALQASLTGHLVLATLHTNDAAGAIARLLDLNQAPYVINAAVVGVLAQRLVRRVCDSCSEVDTSDLQLLRQFGLRSNTPLRRGKGCSKCLQTGYRGRIGIYELLDMTPEVKAVVTEGADTERIRQISLEAGMRPMWQDGLAKVLLGQTSLQELLRTVQFRDLVAGRGDSTGSCAWPSESDGSSGSGGSRVA